MNKNIICGIALILLLTSLGCAQMDQMASSIGDMMTLTADLAEAYPEEEIEVEINSYFSGSDATNNLTAYFINSRYGDLSSAAQETQAREIATFIKENYASISEIDVIVVVFRHHSEVVVASFDSDSTYEFDVKDLE